MNDPVKIAYEKAIREWDGAIEIPEVKVPRYGWKNRYWE